MSAINSSRTRCSVAPEVLHMLQRKEKQTAAGMAFLNPHRLQVHSSYRWIEYQLQTTEEEVECMRARVSSLEVQQQSSKSRCNRQQGFTDFNTPMDNIERYRVCTQMLAIRNSCVFNPICYVSQEMGLTRNIFSQLDGNIEVDDYASVQLSTAQCSTLWRTMKFLV